jgi:hypothetical protein
MKRIAIVVALALAGCSEDAGPTDPNLWLAEKVCAPRTVMLDASATNCGATEDHEECVRRELATFGDEVCGLVAVNVDLCSAQKTSVCEPNGTLVNISGIDCSAEVADYYACLDAKAKGRTKPWPIGGDADAGAADGGLSRDGSADAN